MSEAGRILILIGSLLVIIGVILVNISRIPFIAKLPGDILLKKDGFILFFPITSSIILSIILTVLFKLISK